MLFAHAKYGRRHGHKAERGRNKALCLYMCYVLFVPCSLGPCMTSSRGQTGTMVGYRRKNFKRATSLRFLSACLLPHTHTHTHTCCVSLSVCLSLSPFPFLSCWCTVCWLHTVHPPVHFVRALACPSRGVYVCLSIA